MFTIKDRNATSKHASASRKLYLLFMWHEACGRAGMTRHDDKDPSKIDTWQGRASGLSGGAPGAPLWAPDHEQDEPHTNSPSTGSLATSGRDDVERGDTVSGLGTADVGTASTERKKAVPPGPQSGSPTPGNRFAGEESSDTER
jgi:hypothetical protein